MNAGCYGGETWRYVARVEIVTRAGAVAVEPAPAYAIGYRSVRRADGSAAECVVHRGLVPFPQGDGRAARERIAELLRGESRRSRSICPMPAACSATRRAITLRA